MIMKCGKLIMLLFLLSAAVGMAKEPRDSVIYETRKNFWGKEKEILAMDFSDVDHIRDVDAYNPVFHFFPIRQDTTNTCWCFSAVSFLESELHRLGRGDIELSRMFVVYWEYVEKVRHYVQTKGTSLVAGGSQHNAVTERMKQYGIVRESDYTGLKEGQTIHNHFPMRKEITTYLNYVKTNELWFEDQVIAHVRMILDRYMGRPPEHIIVNRQQIDPLHYLNEILRLPLDDYVSVMSFKKLPFWSQAEFDVPDNWWDCDEYYNVPLDDFYTAIKNAIKSGFSLAIGGDVSEPGKYGWKDIAVVSTFDIPSQYIDQDAREFRFHNKTSTDDHGVHLIGYKRHKGEDWFLIKDSAASAWRGDFKGYHFFHGDYIQLKILTFMVHKNGVADLLEKYNKMHNATN